MNTAVPILPPKDSLVYTAFFCEENIYFLGQTLLDSGFSADNIDVIFLSNPNKTIPLRHQQLQTDNTDYVLWDYHVILQLKDAQQDWILDFDSCLDFPILKHEYFKKTLFPKEQLAAEFHVHARHIPLSDYLRQFSSTRAHMRGIDGLPLAIFPDYPLITANTKSEAIDLMSYIDMQTNIHNSSVQTL